MCYKKKKNQSSGHDVTARMMCNTIFYTPTKQWFKCCTGQLRIYFSSLVFEEVLMWSDCAPWHKHRTESWQWEHKFDKSPKQMLLPRCRHTLTNCSVVLNSRHIMSCWKTECGETPSQVQTVNLPNKPRQIYSVADITKPVFFFQCEGWVRKEWQNKDSDWGDVYWRQLN